MSLHLPVALFCSMHFRRHGGGSRSGCGLWLSDGWYVGLPCVCLRACADGLWTVCEYAICAGGLIQLYILHILHISRVYLERVDVYSGAGKTSWRSHYFSNTVSSTSAKMDCIDV